MLVLGKKLDDLTFNGRSTSLRDQSLEVTQACDRRLARLISCIHHTSDFRQCCHVGNTAQHCRLGSFQDSDFAGDLGDSKSTSGEVLCIFRSRTFVLVSWMCKKQTSVSHSSTVWKIQSFLLSEICTVVLWQDYCEDSKSTSGRVLCIFGGRTFVFNSWMCKKQTTVSHSSTESEIISLDAGLRMDGLPALDRWMLHCALKCYVQQTTLHDVKNQPNETWCRIEFQNIN